METIELLLYNGIIHSIDRSDTVFHWICIKNGNIMDLGVGDHYLKYIDHSLETVDLCGKTVLPGFYDNHINLVLAGINSFGINLSSITHLEELFAIVKEKASGLPPGDLIRGVGFLETKIAEKRFPTRQELDLCAPNNPVIINSVSYHSSSVNSLMLHKLGLPYNLDGIEKDQNNTYSGFLTYQANVFARNKLFARMDNQLRTTAVATVVDHAVEHGITSLVTFEGGFISHENHAEYIIENKSIFPINIKMFYQSTNLSHAKDRGLTMVGGLFLDGTFAGRSAAISQNYLDTADAGTLYYTQAEINDYVLQAHQLDFQVTAHCIGDRAIEQILNAYEYAQSRYFRRDHRHRIEHCELFSKNQIKRAADLDLVLSMQPSYEYYWGGAGGLYEDCIGPAAKHTNPFRPLMDAGLTIAGGSDYDITPINPLLGIHMAVNHPNPNSRIDVMSAVKMFTINGAYAVFEEKTSGSLEIGKKADLVILDHDLFTIDSILIKDIKVLATLKEGTVLYGKDIL